MNIYRPVWTCGRYDSNHNVAIYYNLIEGMSYFFEDYSALVIGKILSLGRNGYISLSDLSEETELSTDNLLLFIEQLKELNIITDFLPSPKSIENYRNDFAKANLAHFETQNQADTRESLPIAKDTAEMAFSDKSGGISGCMFELTYNCCEKCVHCYNIGATRNDSEISHRNISNALTFAEYKRIIDELYDEGMYKVCLTGGDPFMNPFAWDIIDYLFKKDIAIDIYTNGQLIVDKIDKLKNYYPRLVSVSLYSGVPEDHDYITRIEGSWAKTMSVIEHLSRESVPMNLKCCIMQPNLKSYKSVSKIGHKLGIPVQYELNITDSIEGDHCASHYLRLAREQLNIVLQDSETPMYVNSQLPNYGGVVRKNDVNGCAAGNDTFNITPDGVLTPCCAFHLDLGNLHKQSVRDILFNSKTLRWWRNLTLKAYEECGSHEYCAFCNLCPGNNFSEHGTPIKCSENNVYMAKVRYDLANKLKNGEHPLNSEELHKAIDELPTPPKGILQREFYFNKE